MRQECAYSHAITALPCGKRAIKGQPAAVRGCQGQEIALDANVWVVRQVQAGEGVEGAQQLLVQLAGQALTAQVQRHESAPAAAAYRPLHEESLAASVPKEHMASYIRQANEVRDGPLRSASQCRGSSNMTSKSARVCRPRRRQIREATDWQAWQLVRACRGCRGRGKGRWFWRHAARSSACCSRRRRSMP